MRKLGHVLVLALVDRSLSIDENLDSSTVYFNL
jgi:hypothetical protein